MMDVNDIVLPCSLLDVLVPEVKEYKLRRITVKPLEEMFISIINRTL